MSSYRYEISSYRCDTSSFRCDTSLYRCDMSSYRCEISSYRCYHICVTCHFTGVTCCNADVKYHTGVTHLYTGVTCHRTGVTWYRAYIQVWSYQWRQCGWWLLHSSLWSKPLRLVITPVLMYLLCLSRRLSDQWVAWRWWARRTVNTGRSLISRSTDSTCLLI